MKRMAALVALIFWTAPLLAQWPQFRGPNGSGVGDAVDIPVTLKRSVPNVSSPLLY